MLIVLNLNAIFSNVFHRLEDDLVIRQVFLFPVNLLQEYFPLKIILLAITGASRC